MFERLKGVKKGTQVVEQISKGTMNLVNYLVNRGTELKTEDTLWICFNFYNYCVILTFEREKILSKVAYGGKEQNDKLVKPRKYMQTLLKTEGRPHADLHSFRHTFNQSLLELGMNVEDRQKLLAHASSTTTKIYTHPNFDLALQYVNRVPLYGKERSNNVVN